MRPKLRLAALAATLLAFAAPARAEGTPEPLRGAWFGGSCAAPTAMLQITARGAARIAPDGEGRLLRFVAQRTQDGWTIGTAAGAEAPRLMLRGNADALETAEPEAKLRDDRLPGNAPVRRWVRCEAAPPALALHGEGLAFLGTLEILEAACQAGTERCIAALVAEGDVSGDGKLGAAELARLLRGAGWMLAMQDGGLKDMTALTVGVAGLGALAAARLVVDSLDYDGDGRLSVAELAQDRVRLPSGRGEAAGIPLATGRAAEAFSLLRGLIEAAGR